MADRCTACGHRKHEHIGDKCPTGLTLDISAESLERLGRTGHPRLLAKVITRTERDGLFADVDLSDIRINGASA